MSSTVLTLLGLCGLCCVGMCVCACLIGIIIHNKMKIKNKADAKAQDLAAECQAYTQGVAQHRQEFEAETQLAIQRSSRAGAIAFLGAPTEMTPVVEIQIALIQLEAAFIRIDMTQGYPATLSRDGNRVNLTSQPPRNYLDIAATTLKKNREWREAVRSGQASPCTGGATPVTASSNPLAVQRTGKVYSDDGWASVAAASAPASRTMMVRTRELSRTLYILVYWLSNVVIHQRLANRGHKLPLAHLPPLLLSSHSARPLLLASLSPPTLRLGRWCKCKRRTV